MELALLCVRLSACRVFGILHARLRGRLLLCLASHLLLIGYRTYAQSVNAGVANLSDPMSRVEVVGAQLALQEYDTVLGGESESADVLLLRGKAKLSQKKDQEALADCERVIEIAPRNPEGYALRGRIRLMHVMDRFVDNKATSHGGTSEDELKFAIDDFAEAIELDSTNGQRYIEHALSCELTGNDEEALNDYNKAIALVPSRAECYIYRAKFYILQQRQDLALSDFSKAKECDPKSSRAYTELGYWYMAQKRYELALREFNAGIELESGSVMNYFGKAECHERQGDNSLALADLDLAIITFPQNGLAYSRRGFVYASLGKDDLALVDFKKAIDLDPKCGAAYAGRAKLRQRQGAVNQAVADLNKALQLVPMQILWQKQRDECEALLRERWLDAVKGISTNLMTFSECPPLPATEIIALVAARSRLELRYDGMDLQTNSVCVRIKATKVDPVELLEWSLFFLNAKAQREGNVLKIVKGDTVVMPKAHRIDASSLLVSPCNVTITEATEAGDIIAFLLERLPGSNFIMRWNCEALRKKVKIDSKGRKLSDVLDDICLQANLEYSLRGQFVYIFEKRQAYGAKTQP